MATIDLSDLSRSYPFLDLSRKFGVPYEQVLTMVEWFDGHAEEDKKRIYAYWDGLNLLSSAVSAVCLAPWCWQFPPNGRGL